MGKRNKGGFFHKKNEQKEQAIENAEQGDKLEQELTYPPSEVPLQEPTVEQVQAAVAEELKAEDEVKEQPEPVTSPVPAEEPKPVEPIAEPGPAQVTEVEPGKGLTPEQLETAKALAATKLERYPNRLRKSTHASPVKMVHFITEQMLKQDPSTRRTDIVNFCVLQGIAFYTARTQVQVYLNANKRDRENAAKQAAEQASKNVAA